MTLQKFQSHKVVEAMKIAKIEGNAAMGATLFGALGSEIAVSPAYCAKHQPKVDGYYVRYEDGYESWSPAEAFEGGYTLVAEKSEPTRTRYPVDPKERARLLEVFTYHAPKGDQVDRYATIRAYAYELACLVSDMCPPGRERSLALTKLEESVFFANAAIARGEG